MQTFTEGKLPENPRETSNPLSTSLFCFVMPTLFKGRKKVLDENDLYRALNEHKSDYIGNKLAKSWEEQCRKVRGTDKEPSLVKAAFNVFGIHYMILGFILLIMDIALKCSQPYFLGKLVAFYSQSDNTGNDKKEAYLYALGVILTTALNVLILHPNMLGNQHVGMKLRIAISSLVYRKALRLSRTALSETTSGQVLNLMTNDVGRMDTAVVHMHYIWIAPVELIIVTYLIYREIGYSTFFGIGILLIFIPLQGWLAKMTTVLRLRTALRTDTRVRMMNEIISGIQVIKMYAWEIPFGKMLAFARLKEMNAIRYVNYIRGGINSYLLFMTRICIFASLLGFVLLGRFLDAEKAFVTTAYFNLLRLTVTGSFPLAIIQFAETKVSFQRLQKFMLLGEKDAVVKSSNGATPAVAIVSENGMAINMPQPKSDTGISVRNLNAKWNPNVMENSLHDVCLEIKPKTLVAVVGPVGSGKSSLIQAILGELPPTSGSVTVNGTLSFASQEPWLFTGSVRQNILFGLPLDKNRYNMTIMKCALERDFELFPYGDRTIVGERGVSLSGGQRARINLARAVYRQADIYLLDDPLSAVDTHVGRHLFDKCLKDYLREHIVVLVTHQLQFLEQADLIVIMDKGHVSAVGTFESMRQSGLDFAKLLVNAEEDKEENTIRKKLNDGEKLIRNNSKLRQRQISVASIASTVESLEFDVEPKQVQEIRQQGQIGLQLYKKYFGSSGGILEVFSMVVFCIAAQVLSSGADYFLSYWVNKNENNYNINTETEIKTDPIDIYIFSAITIGVVVCSLLRSMLFFNLAFKSSTKLHNAMYLGVTRATMYFFHTNPSGRILNRFSKDMGQVDEILPGIMMDVIMVFLTLFGIVVVLTLVNPWYLLASVIISIIFYLLRIFYLQTSRDVKRLEAINRSPIFSHLGASLNGLSTIRAFNAENVLIAEFDNYQDMHSSGFYMFMALTRAFGYWLDCLCVLYIAIITLSFFLFAPDNGGDVGLAITQAMGLTGMVQYGMRQTAELENTMTAVERIIEYEEIEPEGDLDSQADKKPPKSWPEEGQIKFDDLSLRYAPDPKSDYVLKSLNFVIKPREKVGIVGRTGAGKSSLINALFRLSYNDGSVVIDERDTNDLGLHDLRSKISIIPQEPVLFSGTMRYNLDPFDEYVDAKLWEALDEVKLKEVVADMPGALQSNISEGGTNFSVGQRQLVCLARAILRENRILVMDEATANVDPQTDALIQTTIRNKFKNCTVLTIAHRLHTVMDSDKILVMDAGSALEFGSPYELLTESKVNVFYGMVKETGNATFENLLKIAKKAHDDKFVEKKQV